MKQQTFTKSRYFISTEVKSSFRHSILPISTRYFENAIKSNANSDRNFNLYLVPWMSSSNVDSFKVSIVTVNFLLYFFHCNCSFRSFLNIKLHWISLSQASQWKRWLKMVLMWLFINYNEKGKKKLKTIAHWMAQMPFVLWRFSVSFSFWYDTAPLFLTLISENESRKICRKCISHFDLFEFEIRFNEMANDLFSIRGHADPLSIGHWSVAFKWFHSFAYPSQSQTTAKRSFEQPPPSQPQIHGKSPHERRQRIKAKTELTLGFLLFST